MNYQCSTPNCPQTVPEAAARGLGFRCPLCAGELQPEAGGLSPEAPGTPGVPDMVWRAGELAGLPRPLAYTYARLMDEYGRGEPVAAAWALRDAWECAVRFVACLGLADLARAGVSGERFEAAVATLFKPTGLSLGDWAGLLALACDKALLPAEDRLLPGLADFYKQGGKFTAVGKALSAEGKDRLNLVQWRNKVFGHGVFKQDRGWYAAQVADWVAPLNAFLDALEQALAGWTLRDAAPDSTSDILLDGLDAAPDSSLEFLFDFAPDSPALQGPGQGRAAGPHEHVAEGFPEPVFLAGPEGAALNFGPLLSAQRCLVCGERQIFFYDKGDRRKNGRLRTELLDYLHGRHSRLDEWPEAQAWAARLPEQLRWERQAFDQAETDEDLSRLFRSFETCFLRPDWLMDRIWQSIEATPQGYVLLQGPAGVGKSYIARAVQQEGTAERGAPVLLYHIASGPRSDYRTFITLLADEAKETLKWRTQEIQAKDQGVAGLRAQFREFLATLMRANGAQRLILALDGLDELPTPAAGEFAITDFLVAPELLPRGCVVFLTGRPTLRPGIAEAVAGLRAASKEGQFEDLRLDPGAAENRALLQAYALNALPEVLPDVLPDALRREDLAARVVERAQGIFLYVFHLTQVLASGAFAAGEELPAAREIYPAYLERLRARVGDALYEGVYRELLLFLAAARAPVPLDQLQGWGLRGDKLRHALHDLADFIQEQRVRPWHERVDESDQQPRYAIAHQDFTDFLAQDPTLSPLLAAAHARIATVIESRHAGRWDKLDCGNEEDVYDACNIFAHEARAERATALETAALQARVLALVNVGGALWKNQRFKLADRVLTPCVEHLRHWVEQDGRAELANALARALNNHGLVLQDLGRLPEAEACQRGNVAICRRLVEVEQRSELADDLARALNNHGYVLQFLGRLPEAEACLRESVAILRRIVEVEQWSWKAINLARALNTHGSVLQDLGRLPEAEACQRESVAIRRRLVEVEQRSELADHLAWSLNHYGSVLHALGRLPEAEACQRENVAIFRRLVEVEQRSELSIDLAMALNNHGFVLRALGRLPEAEVYQRESVAILRRLVEVEQRRELANALASALNGYGQVLRDLGRLPEAEACQRESVGIRRRLVEVEQRAELAEYLARSLNNHGVVRSNSAVYPRPRPASAKAWPSTGGWSRWSSRAGWPKTSPKHSTITAWCCATSAVCPRPRPASVRAWL